MLSTSMVSSLLQYTVNNGGVFSQEVQDLVCFCYSVYTLAHVAQGALGIASHLVI